MSRPDFTVKKPAHCDRHPEQIVPCPYCTVKFVAHGTVVPKVEAKKPEATKPEPVKPTSAKPTDETESSPKPTISETEETEPKVPEELKDQTKKNAKPAK